MSIETIGSPALPVAAGTYDTLDAEDANYTTTAGTTSGNNKTLTLRVLWPDTGDVTTPRPLVVYCSTLGWSSSDSTLYDSLIEQAFVSAGAIAVCVQTRVIADEPLSTGENASMPAVRRAMKAAILDVNTALRYVLANYSEHANGVIEPSMVFLAGMSAGAITSMAYTFTYPTHPIAGVIQWSGAFGVEGLGYTSMLRGDNNYRETYYRTPTCAFLGGADSTIGPTYIELLRTRLSVNSTNIVHYDADGGHDGVFFDTSGLTDASTIFEASSNFLIARCRAVTPTTLLRKNTATWRKNWYKLESRYQ